MWNIHKDPFFVNFGLICSKNYVTLYLKICSKDFFWNLVSPGVMRGPKFRIWNFSENPRCRANEQFKPNLGQKLSNLCIDK